MVEWNHTLRIGDIWKSADDREITPQETARRIADRLSALKVSDDFADDRECVVECFMDVAETPDATFDDFDVAMDALYDWGDIRLSDGWPGKRLCWIDRILPKETTS